MTTYRRFVTALVGLVAVIVVFSALGNVMENLSASDQMVIQYWNGHLEAYTTPGWKPQWWGKVTKYHKRTNFSFLAPERGSKGVDNSIEVRFNDAGHARISGTMAYELPTDAEAFIRLHSLYGSQEAVEKALVGPTITKAIYSTGPLMSSKESYADRRNEIYSFIDDQARHGIVKTQSYQRKAPDAITGQEKTVTVVEPVKKADGTFAREDSSPLEEFRIRIFNLAINGILYSPEVEAQIKEQQQMTMAVQTSIMEAKRAEQARITTEQNGMAEAAKAKWAQEVVKATEVTLAEKNKAVALLDVQTAAARKQEAILLGEGDAEARRLKMAADGALSQKLEAWVKVNDRYASAIENYAGNWQPNVVIGGGDGKPGGAAMDFIQLLLAKTANDISLQFGTTPKK